MNSDNNENQDVNIILEEFNQESYNDLNLLEALISEGENDTETTKLMNRIIKFVFGLFSFILDIASCLMRIIHYISNNLFIISILFGFIIMAVAYFK